MTPNRNIEQVIIHEGVFCTYVIFKDMLSAKQNLTGTIYKNPTLTSWQRLLKVMNNKELVELELVPDGTSLQIIGWNKYPGTQYSWSGK